MKKKTLLICWKIEKKDVNGGWKEDIVFLSINFSATYQSSFGSVSGKKTIKQKLVEK